MEKIKIILTDSLTKCNFFTTRTILIPKKSPGEFRHLQGSNLRLKLAEKMVLKELSMIQLENLDLMYGFLPERSTHTAFKMVADTLKNTENPCMFIDLNKAYILIPWD